MSIEIRIRKKGKKPLSAKVTDKAKVEKLSQFLIEKSIIG